jgi:hypothetical protein
MRTSLDLSCKYKHDEKEKKNIQARTVLVPHLGEGTTRAK